jgi:hypothetical protein
MGKVLKLRKYRDRLQSSRQLSKNGVIFIEAVDLFDKAIRSKPGNMGIYVDVADEHKKLRRVNLKYTDL